MLRHRFNVVTLLTAFPLAILPAVSKADPKTFDTSAGLDLRNYMQSPTVKFDKLSLVIDMPDPMSKSFTATETLTFKTAAEPLDDLTLDAIGLQIDRVTDADGKPLEFRQDDQTITVRFPKTMTHEQAGTIVFTYTCSHPKQGMIFTLPDKAYPDRPVSIHTQGESEDNRYWFISHDEPNAKVTTDITVTIPEKFQALSNGALVSKDTPAAGKVRYHYAMSHPQATYLVSLVVGEFSVTTDKWRDKPVEYWLPPSEAGNAMRTFGKMPQMMELYSKLTGVDYPWEKYAESVVYNFAAGGMENTSCTTLTETAPISEQAALDSDSESLIAHELGHQWFGDLITCKSWAHLWLNEGFATFMDWNWQEHADGETHYMHTVYSTMKGVASVDDPTVRYGIVWPYHGDASDTFSRSVSNPYSKGASVLHTMRLWLGPDVFWLCMKEYLNKYAYQSVETDDLRKVIDEVSGRSAEQFFQQWIYRAGSPHFKTKYSWDEKEHAAKVTFEQTQTITADAPAFAVDIPVWFVGNGGQIEKRSTHLDGRFGSIEAHLDHEPVEVDIDPQCAVLADWAIDEPTTMLLHELEHGATPVARFRAADVLADKDEDRVRAALTRVLADEQQEREYRADAAAALATMQQPAARDALLSTFDQIKDQRTRRATIMAIGQYRSDAVAALLVKRAAEDPAITVQAGAISGLANQLPTDAVINVLLAEAVKPSFRDSFRQNAVSALAKLGEARGIEPAIALATYGQPYRSRPRAIDALAKMAVMLPPEKRTNVINFLVDLLGDPIDGVSYAAARALGDIGDDRATGPLQRFADGSGPKHARDVARGALDAIHKHAGEPASVGDLRARIETLEKAREKAERQTGGEHKGEPTSQPTTAATR